MKYTLLKKFHPNQVEEIGHVFEADIYYRITYKDLCSPDVEHWLQVHEIALLIHAGFLEKVEEKMPFLENSVADLSKLFKAPEQKIDLWESEKLKDGDVYWYIDDSGDLNDTRWYELEEDIFRLATKNCHRTKESADEALRVLKSKYEIE